MPGPIGGRQVLPADDARSITRTARTPCYTHDVRVPALLAVSVLLACKSVSTEVSIGLEFPLDDVALAGTNNVTASLSPDGFVESFAVDGPQFELEVELPPDNTARTLSLFLAQNDLLLGYGRTPEFSYAGAADAGVVVFLGFPGTVATLDRAFDLPDASTVAAPSALRGAIALGSNGSTVFVDAYTYELVSLEPLSEDVPAAEDGAFVGDASGSVTRIAHDESLLAHRYVFGADRWDTVRWDEAPARPGAATWYDTEQQLVYIVGGGEQLDVVAIDVDPDDADLPVLSIVDMPALDGPRAEAAALATGGSVGDTEGPELLLVGGDDPQLPLVYDVTAAQGWGEPQAWPGIACVSLDERRVLCGGGLRDEAPSSDGVLIERGTEQPWTVTVIADLLTTAMADVAWLTDERAVYAQGAERILRVDRFDLSVTEPAGSPARGAGGSRVEMPTGVTLLAGGRDQAGAAVGVWQVFSPDVSAE